MTYLKKWKRNHEVESEYDLAEKAWTHEDTGNTILVKGWSNNYQGAPYQTMGKWHIHVKQKDEWVWKSKEYMTKKNTMEKAQEMMRENMDGKIDTLKTV